MKGGGGRKKNGLSLPGSDLNPLAESPGELLKVGGEGGWKKPRANILCLKKKGTSLRGWQKNKAHQTLSMNASLPDVVRASMYTSSFAKSS